MIEPKVRFEGVSKSYDGYSFVVDDLDLAINRGEFLTLLGPSGSGKTTSLMMLAGFEMPTKGKIFLDQQEISNLPPQKRDIGMVFQSYALFPHMTIEENLAFPLQARRMNKATIATKVAAALDMVQLTGLASRRPQQLSGGQQQRIALARALIAEPKLVLMDEPLGALDKQLRDHMQLEIRAIHDRLGVTIVYVTHDQGEALTMSDRVAVFHSGKVQQLASPRDIYEHPANAFVASFVGESNRLHGSVVDIGDGRCAVRLADGTLVRGKAADVTEPGQAAVLSIRPERIVAGEAPAGRDIELIGSCQGAIFNGDHVRIRIVHPVVGEINAKAPNIGSNTIPEPGSPVKFGWKEDDVTVLKDER